MSKHVVLQLKNYKAVTWQPVKFNVLLTIHGISITSVLHSGVIIVRMLDSQ